MYGLTLATLHSLIFIAVGFAFNNVWLIGFGLLMVLVMWIISMGAQADHQKAIRLSVKNAEALSKNIYKATK